MRPIAPVPHVCRPVKARGRIGKRVEALLGALIAPFLVLGALGALLGSRLMAVGVVVETGARPGASAAFRRPGSTYFVSGLTERGDTANPVLLRSMAEYDEKLGGRVTYGFLYDDLTTYFAEGGERAYVARAVGAGATVGTRTLVDRAGAPLNTLRIDAKNAGAWSANVTVEVQDGAIANTFRILVYLAGELIETYYELTTPADAATQINARSPLIVATNLGSATAAPNNNPAVLAPAALSAGTDDRASVVAGTYTAALARFGPELGSGIVAIPGQTSAAVGAGLIAHGKANRRIVAVAPAVGQTVAAAKAAATALRATAGSEFAGLFYPWLTIPDGAGGSRTIPPEGYVAAMRARAFREAGPYRAPAGEIAVSKFVTGTEGAVLTAANVNDLADARVNPVRVMAGTVRLYGWRSLSVDEVNYKLLTGRDTLNIVAMRAEAALEQFVHRPVDGRGLLFGEIEAELVAILDPMRAAGGLYEMSDDDGNRIDPGYVIDSGPSVNTAEVLANNEVRAQVAIRISPAAELITITVTKVAFDAPLA
jgi:hypothetical protein